MDGLIKMMMGAGVAAGGGGGDLLDKMMMGKEALGRFGHDDEEGVASDLR